jgi:uncharacterized protein YbjT (DUF2867 family)
MAHLLIFGATGRTGRHLVAKARAAGHHVAASVRSLQKAADLGPLAAVLAGDITHPGVASRAIAASRPDAVVSCVGGRESILVDDLGVRAIADACVSEGVKRLIVVTSLGCGGSRAHASERLLSAIGAVLAVKTRAEEHVRTLPLDWTILRPGGLLDQPANGEGLLFDDERVHGRITCADLASLIVRLLPAADSHGRTLSAVDALTLSGPPDPVVFRFSMPMAVS